MSNDYSADKNTQAVISVGGTFTSEIEEAGDIDWIKVDLIKDKTYLFDLNGDFNNQNTFRYGTAITGFYDQEHRLTHLAEMKYNRMLIYPANILHGAYDEDGWFKDELYRLVQVFFFPIKKILNKRTK